METQFQDTVHPISLSHNMRPYQEPPKTPYELGLLTQPLSPSPLTSRVTTFQGLYGGFYTILPSITRQEADAIFRTLGQGVPIPPGKDRVEDFVLGSGFGEIRIGKSHNGYVTIKVTEGERAYNAEIRSQENLCLRLRLAHITPSQDIFLARNSESKPLSCQVRSCAGEPASDFVSAICALSDPTTKLQVVCFFAKRILKCLADMHDNHHFHQNLTLESILVTEKDEINLTDFGCSAFSANEQIGPPPTGDPSYFSPEKWLQLKQGGNCNGPKIDAWSAGLILLQLIHGQEALPSYSEIKALMDQQTTAQGCSVALANYITQTLDQIAPLKNPQATSVWSLVTCLLAVEPSARPSPKQALDHPWFTDMDSQAPDWENNAKQQLRSFRFNNQQAKKRARHQKYGAKVSVTFNPLDSPYPTAYYQPSAAMQTQLQKSLTTSQRICVVGPSGSGKTECIKHYLNTQKFTGLTIWFYNADRKSSLDLQYLTLAKKWELVAPDACSADAVPLVRKHLDGLTQNGQQVRLIFDNAPAPSELESYFPPPSVQVILTSRSSDWLNPLDISPMTPDEAYALAQQLQMPEDPALTELYHILEGHPLALRHALTFLRNKKTLTISELIQKIQNPQYLEAGEKTFGKELPAPIFGLWEVIFQTIQTACPEALHLLSSLAYLAPEQIPQELLDMCTHKPAVKQILIDYALLEKTQGGYSINRLLQLRAQQRQDLPKEEVLERAIAALSAAYSILHQDPTIAHHFCIYHGEFLLSHTEAVKLKPPVLIRLRLQLGLAYDSLEANQPAIDHFLAQRKLAQTSKDHASEAMANSHLGCTYHRLKNYPQAIKFHKKHLTLAQQLKDLAGQEIALYHLRRLFYESEEYANMVDSQEQRFAIAQQLNLNVQRERDALMQAYCYLGRLHQLNHQLNTIDKLDVVGDRLQFYQLGGRQQTQHSNTLLFQAQQGGRPPPQLTLLKDEQDLDTKWFANNRLRLGKTYTSAGKAQYAIWLYQKGLEDTTITPQNKAIELDRLGATYHLGEEPQHAIPFYQQSFEIADKFNLKAQKASTLSGLGGAYHCLKDYREAISFYQQFLNIADQASDNHRKLTALYELGGMYLQLKEYAQAMTSYQGALKIATQAYPDHDRALQPILHPLLGICLRQGKYQQAIEYGKWSLKIAEPLNNEVVRGLILGHLGRVYYRLEEYVKAIECHKAFLEAATNLKDPVRIGSAQCWLGMAYYGIQNYQGALNLLDLALTSAKENQKVELEWYVYHSLGQVRTGLKQFEQAIQNHEKQLQLAQSCKDEIGIARAYWGLGDAWKGREDDQKKVHYYEEAYRHAQAIWQPDHPELEKLKTILKSAQSDSPLLASFSLLA